jgi:branched-chain amino acid transport system ATP-binding protein
MLRVEGLEAGYGRAQVLFGVSFAIGAGEMLALLGRNGMGKTTTVRALMGLLRPAGGRVVFDGADLAGLPAHRIARAGIGLVPEGRMVFPTLTVEENLVATARPGRWTLARVLALLPRLAERRRHRGFQLSGGEQQMLAIGRALLTNPKLLLMDEPSEGLAPVIVDRVGEIIAELREQGLAIFLVEQNYSLAIRSADIVSVLANGTVVWRGSPGELDADSGAREAHLGV